MKQALRQRVRTVFLSVLACVMLHGCAGPEPQPAQHPTTQPVAIVVNLDEATPLTLPTITADLEPVVYQTPDGKDGWVLRIPGARPIATPAYADGMVFLGGGYGSHEFYAFDAATGKLAWQMKTGDDGPTAAVVEDSCVAFNTESCTVYVVDAKTGKELWHEWLGDPLMSQPAIADGRLFMSFPSGQQQGESLNQQMNGQVQQQILSEPATPTTAPTTQPGTAKRGHRLLCADLKTGRHLWEQEITSDVISAPVVDGDKVYATCFDGTSFCINVADGAVVWSKHNAATSAPIVADGHVVVTQKQETKGGDEVQEGLVRLDPAKGQDRDQELLAPGKASYLRPYKGGGVGMGAKAQAALDSSVGFSQAPGAAQLEKSNSNAGVYTVAGGWAYQGSRAVYGNGNIYNAQGRFLNCIGSKDGQMAWRATASGGGIEEGTRMFSPPALGREHMYLSTAQGHLVSVQQTNGKVRFMYSTNKSMVFQPALANGCLFVGTADGLLVCLKTGDPDADGWYAWGGNAQHNKNK